MALFRFRTRSPGRDSATDESRRQRLQQLLDTLNAEIEAERNGLRNRYDKIVADAAFSQQALEQKRAGGESSSRIDELTGAMMRYTERLSALDRQSAFVTEMHSRLEAFFRGNTRFADSGKTPGPKPE